MTHPKIKVKGKLITNIKRAIRFYSCMWETIKKPSMIHRKIKVKGKLIINFKRAIAILPLQCLLGR